MNGELTGEKNRQAQEILDLQKQLHDLEASYNQLLKLKNQLQAQLDEAKAKLEDEARVRFLLRCFGASQFGFINNNKYKFIFINKN